MRARGSSYPVQRHQLATSEFSVAEFWRQLRVYPVHESFHLKAHKVNFVPFSFLFFHLKAHMVNFGGNYMYILLMLHVNKLWQAAQVSLFVN